MKYEMLSVSVIKGTSRRSICLNGFNHSIEKITNHATRMMRDSDWSSAIVWAQWTTLDGDGSVTFELDLGLAQ